MNWKPVLIPIDFNPQKPPWSAIITPILISIVTYKLLNLTQPPFLTTLQTLSLHPLDLLIYNLQTWPVSSTSWNTLSPSLYKMTLCAPKFLQCISEIETSFLISISASRPFLPPSKTPVPLKLSCRKFPTGNRWHTHIRLIWGWFNGLFTKVWMR